MPDLCIASALAHKRRHCPTGVIYIGHSRYMDEKDALDCLAALSQQTRLRTFRLLVAHEPQGLAAGEVARSASVPQSTMSTHLAALAHCGLVRSERLSRSIVYRADIERFRSLLVFLLQDCCGGSPEVCAPIVAEITPSCPPEPKRRGKSRD